jgi:hypothetical protein
MGQVMSADSVEVAPPARLTVAGYSKDVLGLAVGIMLRVDR